MPPWNYIAYIRGIVGNTVLFKNEKSLELDGVNQYMSVADDDSLSFGDSSTDDPFSLSAWVFIDADDDVALFSKGSGSNREYSLRTRPDGKLTFQLLNDGQSGADYLEKRTSVALTSYEGRWIHITATYDGSSAHTGITIYINGASQSLTNNSAGTYVAMANTTQTFAIGRFYSDGSNYLDGKIDQAVVWDKELSVSEIKELMTLRDLNEHSAYANIVSWWEFEDAEVSGTTVSDKVGSNDGTLTNSPTRPQCVPFPYEYLLVDGLTNAQDTYDNAVPFQEFGGFAWDFDGTNDHIDIGDIAVTGDWTVSFWVYSRTSTPLIQYPIGLSTTNSGANGIFIEYGSLTDRWGFYDGTVYGADTNLAPNMWNHLVVTQAGTSLSFYVNGEADGTDTVSSSIDLDDINIGVRPSLFGYTNGLIADVCIFDKELSSTEVADIYNSHEPRDETQETLSSDVAGYWRAYNSTNAASGVLDQSGNGNHGTMTNMEDTDLVYEYPRTTESIQNDNEGSFDFDGVNEHITCGTDSSLFFQRDEAFSLSVWVNVDSLVGECLLTRQAGAPTYDGYNWFIQTSDLNFIIGNILTGYIHVEATDNVPSGQWVHLAITYDGSSSASGIKMYYDTESKVITTITNTLGTDFSDTATFKIGTRGANDLYFDGKMSHGSVWDKELSIEEIQEIYNDGSPTDLTQHTASANLVGWWKMDQSDSPTGTVTDASTNSNDGTATNMESGDLKTGPGDYPTN